MVSLFLLVLLLCCIGNYESFNVFPGHMHSYQLNHLMKSKNVFKRLPGRKILPLFAKKSKSGFSDDLMAAIAEAEKVMAGRPETVSRKEKRKEKKLKSAETETSGTTSEKTLKWEEAGIEQPVEAPKPPVVVEATRRTSPKAKIRFTERSQPPFVSVGIENVQMLYGDQTLLKNASFAVSTGDRVGLVGPNGGGKVSFSILSRNYF
jgi:ABC-type multidrug transport system fused ATPase/permease subunit